MEFCQHSCLRERASNAKAVGMLPLCYMTFVSITVSRIVIEKAQIVSSTKVMKILLPIITLPLPGTTFYCGLVLVAGTIIGLEMPTVCVLACQEVMCHFFFRKAYNTSRVYRGRILSKLGTRELKQRNILLHVKWHDERT